MIKVGSIIRMEEPPFALGIVVEKGHKSRWWAIKVYWFDLKEIQPACADVLEVLVP